MSTNDVLSKLKAKIESLKSLEYPCDNSEQNFGFEYALDRLSDSLDSLQQERPCEDLEAEIEKFLASEDSTSYDNAGTYKVSFKDPIKIARHFYELGKQSKEPVSEDLENAARDYTDGSDWQLGENLEHIDAAFKAGAEWQAERLLKGSPMPEDTVIFQKGIEEGKRQGREEMFEELRKISATGVVICECSAPEKQQKED